MDTKDRDDEKEAFIVEGSYLNSDYTFIMNVIVIN